MRIISYFCLLLLVMGCASTTPKISWIVQHESDRFDDSSSCRVTVGSYYSARGSVLTYSSHYYPFVEQVDDQLRVGVMSGGRVKIPVGNVQLRIDTNKAWTITTNETPLDYATTQADVDLTAYTSQLTEEQKTLMQSTYDAAMASTQKIMSPFTAATGDKARQILQEMLLGRKLIYRTIGLNQAGSTTGEYDLDTSLKEALSVCQIRI